MSGIPGMTRGLAVAAMAFALAVPSCAAAQGGTTKAPAAQSRAAQTRPLQETTEFTVDGVRVVLRQSAASDVVAANIYLLGGTQQITPANQGIETLLLAASERGTRRFSKEALRDLTARLGSDIVIEPGVDWSMIGSRGLRDAFDSTWAILTDRVMAPRLDSIEVERVREQLLSEARTRRDSPDALVSALADSAQWSGHPYVLEPIGTVESLASITLADLRSYQREQMVTSRMLVVIVGNVERPRVERLVRATLSTLPRGDYRWKTPPAPPAATTSLTVSAKQLPTNYILGYYAGPPAASSDYAALRVATAVLSGRLFAEIRSRRNLTYAVDAPFRERAISVGGLYVTTTAPDTTLALMRTEIERLREETLDPDGLERLVQQFITEYFLDNETNAAQAGFLARGVVYRGSIPSAESFVEELRKVRPRDVQRVARTYMRGVRFAYVGDPRVAPRRAVSRF
jgi:zinc protease